MEPIGIVSRQEHVERGRDSDGPVQRSPRNEDDAPRRGALPASALSVLVRRVSLNPPVQGEYPCVLRSIAHVATVVSGDSYFSLSMAAIMPASDLARNSRCWAVSAQRRSGSIPGKGHAAFEWGRSATWCAGCTSMGPVPMANQAGATSKASARRNTSFGLRRLSVS